MEASGEDGFSEFENLWMQKLDKKREFENLTEEDITARIECVKQNCFILELQNEVIEKYLKRHNPGAIRELEIFVMNASTQKATKEFLNNICIDENGEIINSQSSEIGVAVPAEDKEKETMAYLIEIVNQEIAELCLNSKIRKRKHEKEVTHLTGELNSYESQSDYLENVLTLINTQFPVPTKVLQKDFDNKLLELIKFMEENIKKVRVHIRRYSLVVHNLKREYSTECKHYINNDAPAIPADLKLLELHIEKLNNELSKDRQVFLDLKFLFDNYSSKLSNKRKNLMAVKMKTAQLNDKIKKMDKRLSSMEKYCSLLTEEVKVLERKKMKLKQICTSSAQVPSPKEYIEEKTRYDETLKKIKSLQRKVEHTTLSSDFSKLLTIGT